MKMKITLTGITKSFKEKNVIRTTSLTVDSGSYQVQLKHGGNVWTFLSPKRMQVGTKVSIYIKQSDMITF